MLASVIAGAAGGLIAIFWWKASQYFIGAWGGFAFGLWIQCFRDGGLIGPIGYRWIMYIGTSDGQRHSPRRRRLITHCSRLCPRWLRPLHNSSHSLPRFAHLDITRWSICGHAGSRLLYNGRIEGGVSPFRYVRSFVPSSRVFGAIQFYVWNIGFMAMFPKLLDNNIQFKVSQTIQIELGLLAAVAIAGIAVQLRILVVLQRKLAEIKGEWAYFRFVGRCC